MENWKPVVGYEESYEVSDLGNVRTTNGRLVKDSWGNLKATESVEVKKTTNSKGYKVVALNYLGKRKMKKVHRLVACAFLGEPPPGKDLVCHNDGNPGNNILSNLRWDDHSENNKDKRKHGTNPELNKTHCPNGHILESPNLRPFNAKLGKRCCLACARARARYSNYKKRGVKLDSKLFKQVADEYYEDILKQGL